MQAFVWNSRFETGIASVDEQHRRLVEIVNLMGDVLIDGSSTEESIGDVFGKLAEYAQYHFADEERLMAEAGLDQKHAGLHQQNHRQFVDQLTNMWKGRAELENSAEVLHGFLSSWLAFHILEEDQAMARQLTLIHQGVAADDAFQREQQQTDNTSAVLLTAMHELYHVLALQNKSLAAANERLEEKVAARTRELLQSEKMAAVGQLAAGVAHEINNPIGFVNSNLGTLGHYTAQLLHVIDVCDACAAAHPEALSPFVKARDESELTYLREDVSALLKESQDGLDRVKHIVQSLKDFAHPDSADMMDADLLAGLESTLSVVWTELKSKADIVRELTPISPVRCIPGQINQVLMNLLLNAAQAIETHGTITLRSGSEGDGVWIEITDSGCGMTEEVRKHVFDPFFTTKPVGKGTGLGLSISWDIIVNKHGGRIDVKSEIGKGSSFTLWLPVTA
jgi:hemerythrin-like metal-binding protein